MVLFWMFFVLVLVLVLDRSLNCIIPSWSTRYSGRNLVNGYDNGDKEHDPRVGERRFVGRNAGRVDAMHAKSSITITSTVSLSTSTSMTKSDERYDRRGSDALSSVACIRLVSSFRFLIIPDLSLFRALRHA